MVTIEQVELLEAKVSKAIDYVKRLSAENERLRLESGRLSSENNLLYGKLDGYQSRISELEVMLQDFKKDQERIEQGIVSSLERLNRFEDSVGIITQQSASSDAPLNTDAPSSFSDDLAAPEIDAPPAVSENFSDDVDDEAGEIVDQPSDEENGALSGAGASSNDDVLDIMKNGRQEAAGEDEDWSIEDNSEKPPEVNPELDIY